jgi:hypothetical protein
MLTNFRPIRFVYTSDHVIYIIAVNGDEVPFLLYENHLTDTHLVNKHAE